MNATVTLGRTIGAPEASTGPVEVAGHDVVHGHRTDIDGLRALAVLAVVAFHFHAPYIRGGFVGVDVFFVISGYLITKIVSDDIAGDRFSLYGFYDRRVRRIFPALFAVFAATVVAELLLGFPVETADFGKALLSAILFSSNMYFWSTANYFSGSVSTMTLLHTWSLSVEEQFYLVFPLLLLGLHSLGRRWWDRRAVVVFAIAALSFAISTVLVFTSREAAFYLVFSRAWELAVGSLLAFGIVPRVRRRLPLELLAATGLALILAAVLRYHELIRFPGPLALAPCLGAAVLIFCGGIRPTFVTRLLSLPPIAFIGMISYSLYLWHWPVLVLYRMAVGHDAVGMQAVPLFAVSVGLAMLSWRFIEQPFRRAGHGIAVHAWRLSALAVGCGIAASLVLIATAGVPQRYTAKQVALQSYLSYDPKEPYRQGSCFIEFTTQGASAFDRAKCLALDPTRKNVLLMGDSHAAHLWRGLRDVFTSLNVLQATASGCRPVMGWPGIATCTAIRDSVFKDFIPHAGLDAIVLASRWSPEDLAPLLATVKSLRGAAKEIVVLGPIPEYQMPLPRLLAQAEQNGASFLAEARSVGPTQVDAIFRRAIERSGATYVSLRDALCPAEDGCRTLDDQGRPMQWDTSHLTLAGAEIVAGTLRKNGLFRTLATIPDAPGLALPDPPHLPSTAALPPTSEPGPTAEP